MTGEEVYHVYKSKAKYGNMLYHANSVKTSTSLLHLGGLASRGAVADQNLPQTSQISDNDDRKYNIWYDTFIDTFDIHSALKRRNHYGPVQFVLNSELLLNLPENSSVLVTRCNPTKWANCPSVDQRYFSTLNDLKSGWIIGHFDHMITISSPSGIVPFSGALEKIILDEPRLPTPQVGHEYNYAEQSLSAKNNLNIPIQRRQCAASCTCTRDYQDKSTRIPYFFSP